jgi:hypothetical protein
MVIEKREEGQKRNSQTRVLSIGCDAVLRRAMWTK